MCLAQAWAAPRALYQSEFEHRVAPNVILWSAGMHPTRTQGGSVGPRPDDQGDEASDLRATLQHAGGVRVCARAV